MVVASVLTLASLPCATLAATKANLSWTQFRANPQHEAVIINNRSLRVTWRVQTGASFSSSPTVRGDTLFIGNNAGALYALNVRNGDIRWQTQLKSSLMANPILWKNEVIVGEGNQTAYWGQGDHPVIVGSDENALIAFDTKTGQHRWSLPLDGSGMPTPAIVDGMLVHHDGFGSFIGADPATGTLRYKRDLVSIASMSAVLPVGGDRVVTVGAQSNIVFELKAHDGSSVWNHAFPTSDSGVGDCPPATDGRAVFCDYTVSVDGSKMHVGSIARERAYALDAKTGKLDWDLPYESGVLPKGNEAAIPLVVGHVVYFGNAVAPYVHAVDGSNGRELWRVKVGGPVKGGPAIKDDTLYVADLSGYVWAIDRRAGRVIGDKNLGAPFNVGSPIIVGETLIIGSKTGAIIAEPLHDIRAAHDRVRPNAVTPAATMASNDDDM